MNKKVDIFWVYAMLLMVILVFFIPIMPPSSSGDVTEYQANEILLKDKINRSRLEIKALKAKDTEKTRTYERERDSLISRTKVIHESLVVYKKVVEATDLNPDSANMAKEIVVSRKIITDQSNHINALLKLNLKADSLLGVRLDIINAQDIQITDWESRFNNIISAKDAEIKAEIKRGSRKGRRGFGLGFVFGYITGKVTPP